MNQSLATYAKAYVIDPDAEKVLAVEQMMRDHLSPEQIHQLRDVLEHVFLSSAGSSESNERYIDMFLDAKRIENCSDRTIGYYESVIRKHVAYIGKPVRFIDANDIRRALSWALVDRSCSPTTVNNERRCLSSFFQWLEDEDIIRKSPIKRTRALKEERADKKPFSDDEIARLRNSCQDDREKAIFELLLSSGVRVSEMCGLNLSDVSLSERECEVLGKGRKRRTCYFSAAAKLHLERYLSKRADEESALFVSKSKPHARLSVSAVEALTRELGKRAGVKNVHPHRFRRTFATNNLRRGMKLEEIQQLLGHSNISTTLIYAKIDKEMLKVNAKRLA